MAHQVLTFELCLSLEQALRDGRWQSHNVADLCEPNVLRAILPIVKRTVFENYRDKLQEYGRMSIYDLLSEENCAAVGCSKSTRTRILNITRDVQIKCVLDTVQCSAHLWMHFGNAGEEVVRVITEILAKYGLRLGIEIPAEEFQRLYGD